MKLILVGTELDSHAGASAMIATPRGEKELRDALLYEDGKMIARLKSKTTEDGAVIEHYEDIDSSVGDFFILTVEMDDPVKIVNREFTSRTG